MKLIGACWYLCGISAGILIISSAITAHPDVRDWQEKFMLTLLGFCLASGAAAIILQRKLRQHPESKIFNSGPLFVFCLWIAVVGIFFLVLGAIA